MLDKVNPNYTVSLDDAFRFSSAIYVEIQKQYFSNEIPFSQATDMFSSVYPSVSKKIFELLDHLKSKITLNQIQLEHLYFVIVIEVMTSIR
ncbi:hypothetical protein JOC36_000523 [Weissella uvarum]|uniref:hypothetical protein n=1 Tax=Weissella uvarum TaxID=1479233 RepID=UPI0019609F27|nr:hypothetical protein [Weissella uvarum]MBM7616974.1 hypothetical protein [Weissella uvarum]MCM0595275.1 hypothetical protein [Weissella uvarum]